jgi:hypothetical protein
LPRSSVTDRHDPVFHHAHLEPFLDQADDAPVADPMLQEADQPLLVDLRSARVFRLIWNLPARVLPQMKVKPRKLKVSGLPSPRRWRRSAAKRPNSMSRVFSGCSVSANFANLTESKHYS